MTILTDQRDRPVIESRQDHRAAAMMDDLANIRLVAFAHGINRDVEHSAGEDLFRIEELRSLLSRARQFNLPRVVAQRFGPGQ